MSRNIYCLLTAVAASGKVAGAFAQGAELNKNFLEILTSATDKNRAVFNSIELKRDKNAAAKELGISQARDETSRELPATTNSLDTESFKKELHQL